MLRVSLNLLILFSLFSCSQAVINRNREGRIVRPTARKSFNGIRKKLALLTFMNEGAYGGSDLGVTFTEELRKEIVKSRAFILDPMARVNFGDSKKIYSSGGFKLVNLTKRAKISGVNYIVYGRIIDARIRERTDRIGILRKVDSYVEVKTEIRIYDINSRKEVFNEVFKNFMDDRDYRVLSGKADVNYSYRRELLRYAIKESARRAIPKLLNISSRLEWVGRVAKIIGNKIYVNAGRESGIRISDILRVITSGQDIFDPENGAMIGVSRGQLKGTIEIIDYFGNDGSVAVIHSGGAIAEGDYVKLY